MKKVLKASAGTGKTYRLSLEYLVALLEGQDFEEIVVMTFTRKATAEIRERIIEQIEDILDFGIDSEVFQSLILVNPEIKLNITTLKQSYNQMLKNKDKINIYTIDSFINKIFKQAIAPYLGIYSYQIVDDNKNNEIIEEVFRKLLDNPADFALMEKFLTDNTERYIKHYLDLIKEMLYNRWKFLLINHQQRQPRETKNLIFYLDECQNILESIAEEKGKEFSSDFYVKDFQILMPEYCSLGNMEAKKEKIIKNQSLFFKNSFWHGGKIRGKKFADLKEGLEFKYQEFLEQLAGYIYNQEMIPYEEEIFKFSERVFQIYDRLKYKEKSFTHTDISNYTYKYFFQAELNLLEDNTVSEYFFELLGSNVKILFIDEFQDTSILQWKILKPLIDKCENVITVGDEKQSIYGWRGGEKELFSRLDQILEGESESLLTCYRSEKELIDFINKFFLSLETDWNYSNVDYLDKKDQGFVEVLLGGESTLTNTETKSFAKLSSEKQQEIVEQNEKITSNMKKEIAKRIQELSSYNNVGILTRSNKDLSEIAAELDNNDIPYILESKDSLIEYEALKPLYFLLSYLNYNDYFQLIKFLRSDLIGINHSALRYLLTNKDKVERFMLGEELSLGYDDIQKLLIEIKFLEMLEYQQLSNYVIENSGIIAKFHDNSAALKNIYYFFKLMRNHSSLSDFMEYVNDNKDNDELKQVGVKENTAVKLMTIHKAKGLSFETEFFYWNPSSGNGGYSSSMELYINFDDKFQHIEDYLLTNSRYEKMFQYLDIDFAEKKAVRELNEEINNVYVALTRPEKNLFFYIEGPRKLSIDNQGRCWSGSTYEFYEQALLNGARVETLCDLIERKQLGQLIVDKKKESINNVDIPYLVDYFKPILVDEQILEDFNNKKDFSMTLEKEINRIKGLAIHYYLEHIKYKSEDEKEYAGKMILARYGNILGPLQIKSIIHRVNKFIDNNALYFNTSWQVFNEYELESENVIYRIDQLRLNEESKEILILDYKSGITKEQAQLDKYREIIEEKTGGNYEITTMFLEI